MSVLWAIAVLMGLIVAPGLIARLIATEYLVRFLWWLAWQLTYRRPRAIPVTPEPRRRRCPDRW